MQHTVKERIKEFLSYLKIGQTYFEKKVGWSNGYINNTKNISADKLSNIFTEYPMLNVEWLITGNGNMIKPKTQNGSLITNEPKPDYKSSSEYTIQLEKENKRLILDNQRKQEIIDGFLSGDIVVNKKSAV